MGLHAETEREQLKTAGGAEQLQWSLAACERGGALHIFNEHMRLAASIAAPLMHACTGL